MTDKHEPKKKKLAGAESPVHVVHAGAVSAAIWRRQSPAGYEYLDFSLTRSFESLSSGAPGNSKNFFARNRRELMQVIEQAADWIDQQEQRAAAGERIAA